MSSTTSYSNTQFAIDNQCQKKFKCFIQGIKRTKWIKISNISKIYKYWMAFKKVNMQKEIKKRLMQYIQNPNKQIQVLARLRHLELTSSKITFTVQNITGINFWISDKEEYLLQRTAAWTALIFLTNQKLSGTAEIHVINRNSLNSQSDCLKRC